MKKRILGLLLSFLFVISLVACDEKDMEKPSIVGAKDFSIVIGETEIDYLSHVSANDNIDGSVEVTVDYSNVKLDTPGEYDVIYTAIDKAGNKQEVIIKVKVLVGDTEAPKILGVQDIYHVIGSVAPNYKTGVTVTDNADQNVQLSVDSTKVNLDKPGTYEVVYTAVDRSGNYTTERVNVIVVSKELAYLNRLDFGNLFTENVKVEFGIHLEEFLTPYDEELPFGVKIENIGLQFELFANLSTYETSLVIGSLSLTVEKINLIMYMGDAPMQLTGMNGDPSLISNLNLTYTMILKDSQAYFSVGSSLDLYQYEELNTIRIEDFLDNELMSLFPEDAKVVAEQLRPFLSEQKETVSNVFTKEHYTQAVLVFEMIQQMVPSLITEDLLSESPFDILVLDNRFNVKKTGSLDDLLNLAELLPILPGEAAELLPMVSMVLSGLSDFNLDLKTSAEGKFESLQAGINFDFGIKGTCDLRITTVQVDTPDLPNFEEYQLVDMFTIMKLIPMAAVIQ